jgi:hypothetical protein
MPTLTLSALALIALLLGALLEPPAARAASKTNAARPSAEAAAAALPRAEFRIVSEDVATESSRRYVAVMLTQRIAEPEISRIADIARAKEKTPFERTIVNFYLPGMKLGQGAWAVATYNPTLKIQIVGLRLDEAQSAAADAAADKRALIGVWLTSPPAAPGRLTLFRSGAKVIAERRLRDGSKTTEELVEHKDAKGRRFVPAAGGSNSLHLGWNGDLELRDGPTLIAGAERLPGIGEAGPQKSEAPALRTRRSAARTATAQGTTSDAGKVLSDKLFKF